jgi:hypothetical protein
VQIPPEPDTCLKGTAGDARDLLTRFHVNGQREKMKSFFLLTLSKEKACAVSDRILLLRKTK